MKNNLILIVLLSFGIYLSVYAWWAGNWVGTLFLSYPTDNGSINYYRPRTFTWTFPWQSSYDGWRNFWSETFDVFTPEYCKKIIVTALTGSYDMFIPTRTALEWNSFKNSGHPRITINSCISGAWCDINSWDVCADTCAPWNYCTWYFPTTYPNECAAIRSGGYNIVLWACGWWWSIL